MEQDFILKSKVRFSRAFNSLFNFEGVETLSKAYGGVAQLGEHLLCKQGVIGSIPFISTKKLRGNTKPHKWAHSSGG